MDSSVHSPPNLLAFCRAVSESCVSCSGHYGRKRSPPDRRRDRRHSRDRSRDRWRRSQENNRRRGPSRNNRTSNLVHSDASDISSASDGNEDYRGPPSKRSRTNHRDRRRSRDRSVDRRKDRRSRDSSRDRDRHRDRDRARIRYFPLQRESFNVFKIANDKCRTSFGQNVFLFVRMNCSF